MNILIKGMEKPMSCDDCIVPLSKCDYLQRRADTCPLIEIVTCGECKYYHTEFGVDECRWRTDESPNVDDFCSYGERRAK